ncbi:MAG: right-handed parallel beta-helix repeat-containing protein, partial [Christensenellaceae bacterium]|nr:right-handed parallel beta-helix repeat-containing protein [Christensenellaceae bacterium]
MENSFKRFLSMVLVVLMVFGTLPTNAFAMGNRVVYFEGEEIEVANETTVVAKIGDTEYATFDDALKAASAISGDVTVEIYDKVTLNQSLTGSYDSINFVGKDTDAEIYLDVQGYITATGKKVAFEDLILSKAAGGFITNAGFMNVAFGVYDVEEVIYTNCTFANGAYASSGKVTFTKCTFKRSHDKYGLWAYGDVEATVDGCTFADYRGIKMYAEGAAKTVDLTVKDTDFSAVTDKPAIVLTYGESVTLENNTYSSTGTFELDLDGAPNGTTVTSDVAPTCVNDNGACGVLVDGKIYTTVAQAAEVATSGSTVTLLHDSTEIVEFVEGVTVDKKGYTADNVTAKETASVEVATYEELVAALTGEAKLIKMTADITASATQSSGYGKAGIVINAGYTLDGQSHTLTINDANSTWDCAIAMKGGTVKNLTIAGAMRGVFMPGANGDVVIDNCVFKDVIYTFNSDAGSTDYTVTIRDTVLNGWTSFSAVHKSVTFENCVFGEGSGYAFLRPYQATTFTECAFEEGYACDTSQTADNSLAFNECTYDGKPLSASNDAMFVYGGSVVIDGSETDVTPPTSTLTNAYTSGTGYWGECGGNAIESFVFKFYNGDTYMGSTSLNNVNGIIDGDVYVSWSIKLDAESNTDEFWTMEWDIQPTIAMQPTRVEHWVDGVKAADVAIEPNWSDKIFPVVAAVTDANGKILSYVNGTEGYTFADAFAADGNVVLLADVTLTDTLKIPAGVTVTLDLNGKTISQTKAQTAGYQMILNDGNLTIKDPVGGGKISYTDSGNGGEYISDVIYNRATLVIDGGTIENLSSATVASNGYPHAVDTYSGIRDTSVTINGGTIYCAEYSAIRMFCVSATYKADLVINGGTIKGAVDMQNGTKVAALGTLTIEGGTFETTKNANNIRFANWNGGATEYGISASIKGGSFNGGITTAYVPAAANWNKKIISGGTFATDLSEYASEGYEFVKNDDGTYGVEKAKVAEVNGTQYTSLQAAIDAAKDGDTVTLLDDVTITTYVSINKSITLDLGGNAITRDGGTGLYINNADAVVVITGEGTIESSSEVLYVNAGTVKVQNGTFYSTADKGPAAYVINNGHVEIYGGTFSNKNGEFVLNEYDKTRDNTSITVYGGTFVNFNPANNAAEGAGTNFVAEGYAALPDLNGNYVVGEAPTATVNNLGATTVPANEYHVYNGSLTTGTVDMPLSFVMQFLADQKAEDMETSPFADWYGDFVLTFTGLENDSFTADGCYLAGHYGQYGWVKVPVDGMTIEEGVRYPVMLGVGLGQSYETICTSVEDFMCALYLTPEILAANPNIQVKLELALVDNSKGSDEAASALVNNENVYSVVEYSYDAVDFDFDYVAKIGKVGYETLDAALAAAKDEDTITLLADVKASNIIVIDKAITLDGNGKKLTSTAGRAINVSGADGVTIKNLTIECSGER